MKTDEQREFKNRSPFEPLETYLADWREIAIGPSPDLAVFGIL